LICALGTFFGPSPSSSFAPTPPPLRSDVLVEASCRRNTVSFGGGDLDANEPIGGRSLIVSKFNCSFGFRDRCFR
jgi:hypothetical protein